MTYASVTSFCVHSTVTTATLPESGDLLMFFTTIEAPCAVSVTLHTGAYEDPL